MLSKDFNFEQVILHVGTNYIPHADEEADHAINEITGLLDELPYLFPGCSVTWSPILPRIKPEGRNRSPPTNELMKMLRHINGEVDAHCQEKNYRSLECEAFLTSYSDIPVPKRNLLAKDGVILNRKGIVAMEHCVYDFIYTFFGIFRPDYYDLDDLEL